MLSLFIADGATSVFAKVEPETGSNNPFVPQEIINQSPIKSYRDVWDLVHNIVVVVFDVFFVVAILFILLAAYNFLIGGQDEKKLATAKTQLKYAVIAIVVALVAGGASLLIGSFLGTAG